MSWQQSATIGLLTAALSLMALVPATPRLGRLAAWLWQTAIVLWLYALWQLMLDYLVVSTSGAQRRGLDILRVERWLHLPSEHATQNLVLSHPFILQAADRYYAWADFPGMGACLIWLWWFRRPAYWRARVTLILMTTAAAVIQAIPVAPPRLVASAGVIDAGAVFHYAVYSAGGLSQPGQLTSMPSVHVAWAAMEAVVIIAAGGSAWRWLVLAHPIVTVFVVIVTGYHYWLDAIVGVLLLALALGLQWVVRAARRRRWPGPKTEPGPAPDRCRPTESVVS